MTNRKPALVMSSLMYGVLQATTMLLFLLSGISTNRRKQYVARGVASPLDLPGLPEFCLSPCIVQVPDDVLYGPSGVAAQMAFKGWIAEVFALWENRYRKELKDSLGPKAIPPEMDAFGDLRRIRNDLLHNNATASADHCGKCTTLRWFASGESMVFAVRHALDFLNQTGVLSLGGFAYDEESCSCLFSTHHDPDTLWNWTPAPKLVSVRTHYDGKDEDPPCKAVTVVFDNGLFSNVPFLLADECHWVSCGDAGIDSDGNLVFASGDRVGSTELYRRVVIGLKSGDEGRDQPRRPVAGPAIRFRR